MTVKVKCTVEQRNQNPAKPTLPIGWHWFTLLYLQFKPTIWALNYPRKHINCTISLQEGHFPIPLSHAEKHHFYWNRTTSPLQSSSPHPPKCNVEKPT